MINTETNVDEVIKLLNEIVKLDQKAMTHVVNHRVSCNEELTEHPTIQCGKAKTVGFLGIINGLFGKYEGEGDHYGWGAIVARLNEEGLIADFIGIEDYIKTLS